MGLGGEVARGGEVDAIEMHDAAAEGAEDNGRIAGDVAEETAGSAPVLELLTSFGDLVGDFVGGLVDGNVGAEAGTAGAGTGGTADDAFAGRMVESTAGCGRLGWRRRRRCLWRCK